MISETPIPGVEGAVEIKRVETAGQVAQVQGMQSASVTECCQFIHREVVRGMEAMPGITLRKVTVQLGLECVPGADGAAEALRVVFGAGPDEGSKASPRTWITLELEPGGAVRTAETNVRERVIGIQRSVESAKSGDSATLRRRLELVLGGPPGFTTGARAEMLSDLLREFGTPMILEAISREWITQFDTGIEASPSVSS